LVKENSSGEMQISRGKIHEYLGMTLDFTVPGEVKITMINYITEIVDLFQKHDDSNCTANTPAAEHLFKVNHDTSSLAEIQATKFHNFMAKCLFFTKRARPDITTAVAFLTSQRT
jgi:hypothetical protein